MSLKSTQSPISLSNQFKKRILRPLSNHKNTNSKIETKISKKISINENLPIKNKYRNEKKQIALALKRLEQRKKQHQNTFQKDCSQNGPFLPQEYSNSQKQKTQEIKVIQNILSQIKKSRPSQKDHNFLRYEKQRKLSLSNSPSQLKSIDSILKEIEAESIEQGIRILFMQKQQTQQFLGMLVELLSVFLLSQHQYQTNFLNVVGKQFKEINMKEQNSTILVRLIIGVVEGIERIDNCKNNNLPQRNDVDINCHMIKYQGNSECVITNDSFSNCRQIKSKFEDDKVIKQKAKQIQFEKQNQKEFLQQNNQAVYNFKEQLQKLKQHNKNLLSQIASLQQQNNELNRKLQKYRLQVTDCHESETQRSLNEYLIDDCIQNNNKDLSDPKLIVEALHKQIKLIFQEEINRKDQLIIKLKSQLLMAIQKAQPFLVQKPIPQKNTYKTKSSSYHYDYGSYNVVMTQKQYLQTLQLQYEKMRSGFNKKLQTLANQKNQNDQKLKRVIYNLQQQLENTRMQKNVLIKKYQFLLNSN